MKWKSLLTKVKYPIVWITLFISVIGLIFQRQSSMEGFQTVITVDSDAPIEAKKAVRDLENPEVMCPVYLKQWNSFKTAQDVVSKGHDQNKIQTNINLINKLREKISALGCPEIPEILPDVIRETNDAPSS